jgi:hypothetical protein
MNTKTVLFIFSPSKWVHRRQMGCLKNVFISKNFASEYKYEDVVEKYQKFIENLQLNAFFPL